jgi:hypothetical protein
MTTINSGISSTNHAYAAVRAQTDYAIAEDAERVSTLPASDPTSSLINSGDIGSAIAALVYLTKKEQRENARASRDAAYSAQEAAEKSELAAMDREADAKQVGSFFKAMSQFGSAACSFGAAGSSERAGKWWEAAGKTSAAAGGVTEAVTDFGASKATRDVKAASQQASHFERLGGESDDDVRDAEKSMDKAVDFLKEWRSSKDAATSAAIHRA